MVHASLFSGIGGPEVAAAMLGWNNAFHCEINPFGRKVLEYWFPYSKSYEDITKTDFSEWRGKIDVLSGGFPCQPFSNAGKRRGENDDRYLWPQMLRVIKEVRPSWIVAENVAGIKSMVEQGEIIGMEMQTSYAGENSVEKFKYIFTVERVCCDLEAAGYSVQPMLIPACAVGAPHRRDRVFIIANRLNPRTESLQFGRENGVHEFNAATNTYSKRQSSLLDKERIYRCDRLPLDKKWQNISLTGIKRPCGEQSLTNCNCSELEREINQAEKRNGKVENGQF